MKRLILVTSPPACGKTYVSKQLARHLKHVVYLDKDTLIVLSKQIFKVANQPYDRSSAFFEEHIRNFEYEAVVELAMEALEYEDMVLINAPFSREVRNVAYMAALREKLRKKNARLTVIWVQADVEVCRQRMIARKSERDTTKLANWERYIKTRDFNIPQTLDDPNVVDDLLLFPNNDEEQFQTSMKQVLSVIEGESAGD